MTKWISSSFCRQLMQLIIKWMNWETPKGFERERESTQCISLSLDSEKGEKTEQWKGRCHEMMINESRKHLYLKLSVRLRY